MKNNRSIIRAIAVEVQRRLSGEGSGHDWWHVWRVWQMAKRIGRSEHADLFIVELAALVHEMGDEKIAGGVERHSRAQRLLAKHGVVKNVRDAVTAIITRMSFRDNIERRHSLALEGRVVQDADRLDAMGAIGVARAFAFGGHLGRQLHDPSSTPELQRLKTQYVKREGTTIHHFYEKLLLLKNRMNTQTAKKIAAHRHRFMQGYLKEFFGEWDEKK